MGFYQGFPFLLIGLLYLAVIGFVVWLVYRFVRAHERLADNTEKIARSLGNKKEISK